jgi:hypothetical protein
MSRLPAFQSNAHLGRLSKEIGPIAARFPLKIQPHSFQWVVFFVNSTRIGEVAKKSGAETNALKL